VVDAVVEFVAQKVLSPRVLLADCSYGGYIAAALARRIPDLLLVCSGVKISREDRDPPTRPTYSASKRPATRFPTKAQKWSSPSQALSWPDGTTGSPDTPTSSE
jgi:pimeloyl-ACP methyl ester carboxylesterase